MLHTLVITIFVQAVVLTSLPICLKHLPSCVLTRDLSNTKLVY
jgi:hypothetical protein